MAERQKIMTIGVNFENMAPIRKFQNLVELETSSNISLGQAVCIASMIGAKIMDGRKPTKEEIISTAKSLQNG